MSHSSGKIEIVGKTKDFVYFKYHRAAKDEDSGRFLAFRSNPHACWFDDYDEAVQDCPISLPFSSCMPMILRFLIFGCLDNPRKAGG
jgi:hypothetical protein